MTADQEKQIAHMTTLPSGADVYACETCGMTFKVQQEHEAPVCCPWGRFHE